MTQDDPASHSFGMRRAEWTATMFGPPRPCARLQGIWHVLVSQLRLPRGQSAVLIRAIEPEHGIEHMIKRRGTDKLQLLCSRSGTAVRSSCHNQIPRRRFADTRTTFAHRPCQATPDRARAPGLGSAREPRPSAAQGLKKLRFPRAETFAPHQWRQNQKSPENLHLLALWPAMVCDTAHLGCLIAPRGTLTRSCR